MKRHQIYGSTCFFAVILWLYLKISRQNSTSEIEKWLIDVTPWYLLIIFGCYCLTKLGLDLCTFRDYPEEISRLENDIKVADDDLRSRGFMH